MTNQTLKDIDRAFKALEERDELLDKIRADVTAIAIHGQVDEHTMFIRTGEQVKHMVLEIIDKYKASPTGAEGSEEV